MASLFRCVLIGMFFAFGEVCAQASNLIPYYFPEGEQCTLVLDFQPHRPEFVQLSKEARALSLAKDLLKEFRTNGSEKCSEAKNVRLLAVFVPGTDNYGRPDFGSRVNLIRLEGSKEKILQGAEKDFVTTEQITDLLAVTIF